MRAMVFHGPGQKSWDEVPDPIITQPTDAIIRVEAVTICGTDLHILRGDVPEFAPGRILGHEAVGSRLDAAAMITHRFTMDEFPSAYDTFARAGETGALKVVITAA